MEANRNSSKSLWSYIGLLVVAMIWGGAFVVVKNTLVIVQPSYLVAIRFSIAFVAMLAVFGSRLKGMRKSTFVHGLIVGGCLFAAYLIQTIGCNYTTAGKNAFLTAIYIIIVPFIHWILKKQKPENRLFAAAVIGLVGIGFISLDERLSMGIGDILTIICGFFFAMQIAFQDEYVEKDDPVVICLIEMFVCGAGGWICAPFIDGRLNTEGLLSGPTIFGILFLGLVCSLICQLLQSVCQKYTKPESASLIMSMESLFGALSSMIFLHERMTGRVIAGCILMMIAILLSQLDPVSITKK